MAATVAVVVPLGVTHAQAAEPVRRASAVTAFTDTFSRPSPVGWVRSDSGSGYVLRGPASSYSVSNGSGVLRLPQRGVGHEVLATDVALRDVDQSITLTQSRLATGYGSFMSIEARYRPGVGAYRVRLRATADGTLRLSASRVRPGAEHIVGGVEPVVPGLRAAAGAKYRLRMRVAGASPTVIEAKAWKLGTREPASWQLTVHDSTAELQSAGSVGLFPYVGGDATNAPITYRVDNWEARRAPKQRTTTAAPTPTTTAPAPTVTTAPAPAPAPTATSAPAPTVTTAPAPAPTVTTAPAPAPAPAPVATAARPGSAPVGTTTYPVPAGAVFAAPDGSDTAAGTEQAPVRTVGRALRIVPTGGTVVLRGGSYHESVETPYGKRVTIQSYPSEAVWLDGSRPVSGFVSDGSTWRKDGWTVALDSTDPTAGAGDYWRFVDPAHPMAAHPDMVWLDDRPLRQVGSLDQVTADSFFVDKANGRLHLGADPAGRRVDAAALGGGLYVNKGAGSVVRGLGLRRFGTSLRQYGSLKAFADNTLIENVVVDQTAARGIGVDATGVTLRNVTVTAAGQLGIGAHHADRLQILDSLVSGNNTERFHTAPEAGGIKITSSREDTVRGTTISDNRGHGLWVDNSSLGITAVGNRVLSNSGHGVFYEISGAAVLADNLVQANAWNGLHLVESNDVQVYNNALVRNGGRAIEVWEGSRDSTSQTSWYIDNRHPGSAGVLWNARNVSIRNNAMVAQDSGGVSMLGVDDGTRSVKATAMVSTDSNGWFRATSTAPRWLANWCDYGSATTMRVFNDLAAFATGTGQDRNGFAVQGSAPELSFRSAATGDWRLADAGRAGAPLPASVATAVGLPAGSVLPIGKITR